MGPIVPRHSKGPRLWLDKKRRQWVIRDGAGFIRTGCPHAQTELAEKLLAKYIARKYEPAKSDVPPIADILFAFDRDKIPAMRSRSAKYNISNLAKWWGDKTLLDVNKANCQAYAATKTQSAARADLEKLSAAIKHWHQEISPLAVIPHVLLPDRNEARDRWLTVSEAARLLKAARRTEHLKRFIMIGLYTGSRSAVIRKLQWSWLDLEARTMRRRAKGTAEVRNKKTPPIRIPRKLLAFLKRWKRNDAGLSPYVVNYMGKPIKREPHTAWNNAKERAKLDDVVLHTLRHTRATWMVQRGVPPWQAAGFLGMTVRVLEQTYGHHSPDFQKDAADI